MDFIICGMGYTMSREAFIALISSGLCESAFLAWLALGFLDTMNTSCYLYGKFSSFEGVVKSEIHSAVWHYSH